MAVIYLKHPTHGAKVAISDMEAEADMQNGWEQYDIVDAVTVPVMDSAPESSAINALQPRRRGRPPREAA